MLTAVQNEVPICAPPATVWAVLMDTVRYAEWNPRLVRVDGALAAGAVVTLHYAQARAWLPSRYTVDVDACALERELRWSGPRSVAKHLMRASHFFRLASTPQGSLLVHGETFSGVLASALWPVLGPVVAANHDDVNRAIRARCEGHAAMSTTR